MAFLERARSMYERGDAVRAAVTLAEGLKRQPHDGEALEWLLHLYVEELPKPGLEEEILRILEAQPSGERVLDLLLAELREFGAEEKLTAMEQARARVGFNLRDASSPASASEGSRAQAVDADGDAGAATEPGEGEPSSGAPVDLSADHEGACDEIRAEEDWESFRNPLDPDERARPADQASAPPRGADALEEEEEAGIEDPFRERRRLLVTFGVVGFILLSLFLLMSTSDDSAPSGSDAAPIESDEGIDQE